MLDTWDFTFGNVRIDIELRRWRNGRWQRGASHRGDIGYVGHARDGADRGRVWNVRRRLKQRRFVVHSDGNIAHDAGRWRSYRHSAGVYRNRQPWGQRRNSRTDGERIAHRGNGGTESSRTNRAHSYISAHCFVLVRVSGHRARQRSKRLLNT
jgi:hypothetical protein